MHKPRADVLWSFVLDNYLLLVVGTVTALLWANLDHDSYDRFAHALHFTVNDIGMVFFFALAAKEIVEATLPGGPLASPREAGVPVLAAVGGMIGPAVLYVGQAILLDRSDLIRGWAIPCATDIAFSYMAARIILAGIGFTVALFFSTAAFPPGDLLNQVKMGALLSFVAVPLAFGFAWITGFPATQGRRLGRSDRIQSS